MADDVSSEVSNFVDQIKQLLFGTSNSLDDIRHVFSETPLSVRERAVHDVSQLVGERTKHEGQVSDADNFVVNLLGADAPEELFLEFMALAEAAECHDDFFRMIQLSNVCRGMMNDTRGASSSAWICESFARRAKTLKPEDYDASNEDVLQKDSDSTGVIGMFYRAVIDEICSLSTEAKSRPEIYKNIIIASVLSLYGEPLALMPFDLDKYSGIAAELFTYIALFKIDPLYFLDHRFKNVSKVALGVFNLYLFSVDDNLNHISYVYSPKFILDSIFTLSSAMISSEEPPIQQKGLLLVSCVLKRAVRPKALTWSESFEYLKILAGLMVFSQMKDLRRLAVQVFDSMTSNFTEDSAYCLALNAHHLSEDSGFLGHIVTKVKGFIVDNNSKFRGKQLVDLLSTYCKQPTNFHASTDVVLSTLNLLRFLLVYRRDLGVSTWLRDEFDESYLKPLSENLRETIKATNEMRLELPGIQREEKRAAGDDSNDPEMSLVVGGVCLPSLSTEEKIEMIESSLTKFELIGSVMSRIEELLVEYKETCNKTVS